ncbi:hypothetical protein ACVXZ4_08350 [Lacisediminihabitans sp. FW035]
MSDTQAQTEGEAGIEPSVFDRAARQTKLQIIVRTGRKLSVTSKSVRRFRAALVYGNPDLPAYFLDDRTLHEAILSRIHIESLTVRVGRRGLVMIDPEFPLILKLKNIWGGVVFFARPIAETAVTSSPILHLV